MIVTARQRPPQATTPPFPRVHTRIVSQKHGAAEERRQRANLNTRRQQRAEMAEHWRTEPVNLRSLAVKVEGLFDVCDKDIDVLLNLKDPLELDFGFGQAEQVRTWLRGKMRVKSFYWQKKFYIEICEMSCVWCARARICQCRFDQHVFSKRGIMSKQNNDRRFF